MTRRLATAGLLLPLLTCGPGSDVRSFPNAYANAECHFAYHCCTPADRASAFFDMTALATQLNFDDEPTCDTQLGYLAQDQLQPLEASVQDKRMAYNQQQAQNCLNALDTAANTCDVVSFAAAVGTDGGCSLASIYTGLAAGGGTCTDHGQSLPSDCATPGAVCNIPNQTDAGLSLYTSQGTCTQPPTTGQPCVFGEPCTPGNCCDPGANNCAAYQPIGSPCDTFVLGTCSAKPCDPATSFCSTSLNPVCAPLVANGGTCQYDGQCQSGSCPNGTCQGQPTQSVQYQICTGNPDGI